MFSCVVSNLKVFEWIKIIALHETIYTDWQSTKRCVNTMAIRNFGFSKNQNEQMLLFYSASVSLVTIKNRGGGKGKTLPHPFSTYMYVSILNDFWWFGSFSLYLFSIIQVCVKIIRILTEADTNQCTTIHDCWIMCCYYTHGPPYIQPSNVRPRLINNNDAATWLICNNPVIMNICL